MNEIFIVRPLGLVLQEAGLVPPTVIELALQIQTKYNNMRIGEILSSAGRLKPETANFFADRWPQLLTEKQVQPLGEHLQKAALLDASQIRKILDLQKEKLIRPRFGEIAVERGWLKQITLEFFLKHIGSQSNLNLATPELETERYHELKDDRRVDRSIIEQNGQLQSSSPLLGVRSPNSTAVRLIVDLTVVPQNSSLERIEASTTNNTKPNATESPTNDYLALLERGVTDWNEWKRQNLNLVPNLSKAKLNGANLNGIDLSGVDLSGADLSHANLTGANLSGAYPLGANLNRSILSGANLCKSYLSGANLSEANLSKVNLSGANLLGANLSNANFYRADLSRTILSRVQAFATNFTQATFTGACLDDWHISDTTWFDEAICDYIYLKQQQQKRYPSSHSFAPGEFEKLLRRGIEPSAARAARRK